MAKQSRHYRAVRKEVESKPIPANGVFLPNDRKRKLYGFSIIAGLVLFIDGILLGYLLGRE